MQGNPLKELILVLVLVALLAPVILKLTGDPNLAATDSDPTIPTETSELTPTVVRLQFAHAPRQVVLTAPVSNGQAAPLWVVEGETGTDFDKELSFDLGERLLGLPLSVTWPEGTSRTAVTITIEPEGYEAREVTFWGEGELNEFIEVHWDE